MPSICRSSHLMTKNIKTLTINQAAGKTKIPARCDSPRKLKAPSGTIISGISTYNGIAVTKGATARIQ